MKMEALPSPRAGIAHLKIAKDYSEDCLTQRLEDSSNWQLTATFSGSLLGRWVGSQVLGNDI